MIFPVDFKPRRVSTLDRVHANVVDLKGVLFRVDVPRGQPIISRLPELPHLGLGSRGPRLVVTGVLATVGEEVAAHGEVEDEVKLVTKRFI